MVSVIARAGAADLGMDGRLPLLRALLGFDDHKARRFAEI
jgi:hypothetical protein